SNGVQLTVSDACGILKEDALYTFTKLDLCLNGRLADRLTANSNPAVGVIHMLIFFYFCVLLQFSLLSDGVGTRFTVILLCLSVQVLGPSDVAPEWPADNSDGFRDIKNLVDELIKQLLAGGWIYPSSEPVGGHTAYHLLDYDNRISEAIPTIIETIIRDQPEGHGAPSRDILSALRSSALGDWRRLSMPALRRVLDRLEENSRIFQIQPFVYKIA
ncbi:hypothetical protein FBUS_05568, partial [Fasciolopsis buskii]